MKKIPITAHVLKILICFLKSFDATCLLPCGNCLSVFWWHAQNDRNVPERGGKQWKLKESTRTIQLSWLHDHCWKWWSHIPSPTTKHWGFSSFMDKPVRYLSFPCGISFLVAQLLELPHSTDTRGKVEAARGEDGRRNTPSNKSYPIHHQKYAWVWRSLSSGS